MVSTLTSFAAPGDAVLLHSPTYIGFTMSIENNGYKIVHSPLIQDEQGIWRMDYADMESKIKANNIHVAVFCSPHNPCGLVWEKEADETIMPSNKNKVIVEHLYDKGIFQLKDSVITVEKLMGISKNTIYMHIRNYKKKSCKKNQPDRNM